MTDQSKIDAVLSAVTTLNTALSNLPDGYSLRVDTNVSLIGETIKTNGAWANGLPKVEVLIFKKMSSTPDAVVE